MITVKRIAAWTACVCSMFFLYGCATTIVGLQHDPSFTYDSLLSSKMIVGGVTSTVHDFNETDVNKASLLLRNGFVYKRKEFRIDPQGTLLNAMNREDYFRMLSDYNRTGVLSEEWLRALKSAVGGTRYAVFARIEENHVSAKRSRSDIIDYSKKDKDGKNPKTGERITSEITRDVTVSLQIYDLELSAAVWGGTVNKSPSNSELYDVALGSSSDEFANNLANSLVGVDKRFPMPPPPALDLALSWVFQGFAGNLPKAPKKK